MGHPGVNKYRRGGLLRVASPIRLCGFGVQPSREGRRRDGCRTHPLHLRMRGLRPGTHPGGPFFLLPQIFILSGGKLPGGPSDDQLFPRHNFICPAMGSSCPDMNRCCPRTPPSGWHPKRVSTQDKGRQRLTISSHSARWWAIIFCYAADEISSQS